MVRGELAPFEDEACQLLKTEHGVAAERVAGCVVTSREVRRWDAYNKVIDEHLGFHHECLDLFEFAVNRLIAEQSADGTKQQTATPRTEADAATPSEGEGRETE